MARDYLRRLTLPQFRLYTLTALLTVYVVANAVYLAAVRSSEAAGWEYLAFEPGTVSVFHQAMVLSHTAIGVILIGIFAAFAWSHMRTMWRSNRRAAVSSGVVMFALGGGLAVSGMFILTEANSNQSAWIWWTHVTLALIVPGLFVVHRMMSSEPISRERFWMRGAAPVAGLTLVMLLGHVTTMPVPHVSVKEGETLPGGARDADRGLVLEAEFRPEILIPPGSTFFPSSTTTTTGNAIEPRIILGDIPPDRAQMDHDLENTGFVHNEMIGANSCARCHADVTEQWASSAHRFASFNNPYYEAAVNLMRLDEGIYNEQLAEHMRLEGKKAEEAGIVQSNWCSGCHDPAVMMSGLMNSPIDRTAATSQAGLTCQACHAIDAIHGVAGNAMYNVVDHRDDPYMFSRESGGLAMFLHDAALQAKPTAHKQQMLKEFHKTSEFCSTCHKVSLDEPVNDYRWIRGQNEYDAWHDSGVSHNAARTFYLPPVARNCQDCHMPLEDAVKGDLAAKKGKVRSHRFVAANTALPFLRGDHDHIARTEKMLQDSMRIEVFAVQGANFEEAPVMSLADTGATLPSDQDVFFHVVVRNKGVGHTFPGGTNDSNEGWIEFSAEVDGERHILSGYLEEDLQVDKWAHFFRAIIIDENSQRIHRRDAQNIRIPVYANVVGPGTADVARYRVQIPAEWAGRDVKIRARLLWRKFEQLYNRFSFESNRAGFAGFDEPPVLPITQVATHEVTVRVGEKGAPIAPQRDAARSENDWIRYNDYGIAMVLDGDTTAAYRAFEAVKRMEPTKRDGSVNLARVALRDGNLETAFKFLAESEALVPGNPMTAYWWGRALQSEGSYERSINAFSRTLQDFPNDRDTLRRLGRTYYLDRQYEKSIETMERVLEIDPEDRVAHYHRLLSLRGLGDEANAAIAAKAVQKYGIDESAREWVKEYALENPADFLHSQPIFVHDLRRRLGHEVAAEPGTDTIAPAPDFRPREVETWVDPRKANGQGAAEEYLASLVTPAPQ